MILQVRIETLAEASEECQLTHGRLDSFTWNYALGDLAAHDDLRPADKNVGNAFRRQRRLVIRGTVQHRVRIECHDVCVGAGRDSPFPSERARPLQSVPPLFGHCDEDAPWRSVGAWVAPCSCAVAVGVVGTTGVLAAPALRVDRACHER